MKELEQKLAIELAWGLIANAHGGNWDLATKEWRAAAIRWRDRFQDLAIGSDGEEVEPGSEGNAPEGEEESG